LADLRDRNDLATTQQNSSQREQSLGISAINDNSHSNVGVPATRQPLGVSALDNSNTAANANNHDQSNTGYVAPQVGQICQGRQQIYSRPYLVEGAGSPPSLQGIVNLTNTVHTTTHIRYAPGKSKHIKL